MSFKLKSEHVPGTTANQENLVIQGRLTIENIQDIKTKLQEAVANFQNIQIYVEQVEAIDLTFLQLLYSLKRSFSETSKNISFNLMLSDENKTLLRQSGLESLLS